MAYVAPNWKNGQAPALDAAALQAISDAIVANQTKNAQQDSSISSLQSAVSSLQSGGAKIATGSYTGTGTYGSSNPNSITFPFTPKLVIIYKVRESSSYIYSPPIGSDNMVIICVEFYSLSSSYTSGTGPFIKNGRATAESSFGKKSGNTLSWYNTGNDMSQMNSSGNVYYWFAIG